MKQHQTQKRKPRTNDNDERFAFRLPKALKSKAMRNGGGVLMRELLAAHFGRNVNY